jgi:hypothetical protein
VRGLAQLGDLPALTHLMVASESGYAIPRHLLHPGVTHLSIICGGDTQELDLTHLPTAFPSLTELVIRARVDYRQVIDVTGLGSWPQLTLQAFGLTPGDGRFRGAEAFPGDRIRWN